MQLKVGDIVEFRRGLGINSMDDEDSGKLVRGRWYMVVQALPNYDEVTIDDSMMSYMEDCFRLVARQTQWGGVLICTNRESEI
jgi:hypothetical protein